MDKIFELYDCVVDEHISFHKSLQGALAAMSEAVAKITPGLCRDYEDDASVDFNLKYQVKSHIVKE